MVSISVPSMDSLISLVAPYAIPILVILIVLGAIMFVLRSIKYLIILAVLVLLLMYISSASNKQVQSTIPQSMPSLPNSSSDYGNLSLDSAVQAAGKIASGFSNQSGIG